MLGIGAYDWWKFLHLFGVVLFMMAHGVSVAVAFRLPKELERERMRALLQLSRSSLPPMYVSLMMLIAGGVGTGERGGWWAAGFWDAGWLWLSIALLVLVTVIAGALARPYYARLRDLLAQEASDDALEAARASGAPGSMAALGFAVIVAILWLMVTKPF